MLLKKLCLISCALFLSVNFCNAQLEGAYASTKDFSALGVGGFLNFSFRVAEVNHITLDAGYQYFKDKNTEELILVPILIGFRYSLDQTGSGWYVEPNAGYTFNAAQFGPDVEGTSAGIGLGYLVIIGNVPINVGCKYEHVFGDQAANVISLRISHTISF